MEIRVKEIKFEVRIILASAKCCYQGMEREPVTGSSGVVGC